MKPRALLICASTLVCSCHDGRSGHARAEASTEPAAAVELAAAASAPAGVALERQLHRADITEVVLDPRASAALSLDREGGLRLWTSLDEDTAPPLRIPIEDPRDMSLARSGPGAFVLALVDTAGGAEVVEVREHEGRPRLTPLFSIPPTDPLFELHVLDGGERLLALGIDHRVRVYDRAGVERASLAEPGFVPWQLRHVETPAGVELLAVLAGPSRVQRLALDLDADALELVGEPLELELDRGPNRNDLALTPDGTRVAVLTRPRRRGDEWSLKLVDLRDGSAREFSGHSSVARMRPRLHLLAGERALLDDGTGVGQLISLASPGEDGLAVASEVELTPLPLPGAGFEERHHTTVEAGVRVVPRGPQLVVDRLERDDHLRLGRRAVEIASAGLSPDGARVIWGLAQGWVVEPLGATGAELPAVHTIPESRGSLVLADFVDDERVVLLTTKGAELRTRAGALLDRTPAFGFSSRARFARAQGPRAPALLIHSHASVGERSDAVIELLDAGFAEPTLAPATDSYLGPRAPAIFQRPWSHATNGYPGWGRYMDGEAELETALSAALGGEKAVDIHEHAAAPDGVHYWVSWRIGPELIRTRAGSEDELGVGVVEAHRAFERDLGVVGRLVPSPDGRRVAILHHHGGEVSVFEGETLAMAWMRVDVPARTLAWSDDGELLAIAGGERGGVVVDAASGELVHERRDFGLDARVLGDGEPEGEAD